MRKRKSLRAIKVTLIKMGYSTHHATLNEWAHYLYVSGTNNVYNSIGGKNFPFTVVHSN